MKNPKAPCLPHTILLAIQRGQKRVYRETRARQLAFGFPDSGPESVRFKLEARTIATKAAEEWKKEVLAEANGLSRFLGWNGDEVSALGKKLAARFLDRMQTLAKLNLHGRITDVLEEARSWVFDDHLMPPIPGLSIDERMLRATCPKFWRRFLRRHIWQARERLYIKLGLIGGNAASYASPDAIQTRRHQLRATDEWLDSTVIINEEGKKLVLRKAIGDPKERRLAKILAFVNGLEGIARDENLEVMMITVTLEPEWHPNPTSQSHGHQWNGKYPDEANRELTRRFASIRKRLDGCSRTNKIRLTGFRVSEPHRDGCPHWHIVVLVQPADRIRMLAEFMNAFPHKLKIRGSSGPDSDQYFDTRDNLIAGVGRPGRPKPGCFEVAQVDVLPFSKTPRAANLAGYMLKYLLKVIDTNASDEASTAQRAVDAHRMVWRIRGHQFFGIKNAFSRWDELRKAKEPPSDPFLFDLWAAARGSGDPERPEGAQGDAKAFLMRLGAVACLPHTKQTKSVQLVSIDAERWSTYGLRAMRVIGVEVSERILVKKNKEHIDKRTGEITDVEINMLVKKTFGYHQTREHVWMVTKAG